MIAKCQCVHCGGSIEFDEDAAGQETCCPHCAENTWIDLPQRFSFGRTPVRDSPTVPKKPLSKKHKWIAAAVLALIVLVLASRQLPEDNIIRSFLGFVLMASILICTLLLALGIYFMPTLVAVKKKKVNSNAIFVLNFCLGWTFIFWVMALVWSNMKDDRI